jgi:hypothetical protein
MRRKGLAGLVAGGALAAAALMPSAALAHPCSTTWSLSTATFLSANNSDAAWAGSLPTMNNDTDCAPVEDGFVTGRAVSDAAADPVGPAVASYTYSSNMNPLGYSGRVPPLGTGNSLADINSDIAFKGKYAFQGHWSGFRVINIEDPANPVQVYNTEACRHTSGQGDVVVHGNILVRTWDSSSTSGANANATCMGEPVTDPGLSGFEGIHIWNIANPEAPVYVRKVRMASGGNGEGAPAVGCGAHTATGVPDDARGYFYLYVGGSSGTCPGMDIVRINTNDLNDAKYLRLAASGRSCHDNNVITGSLNMAMCAGGNGFSVFKWDPNRPADEAGTPEAPGGIANPTLISSVTTGGTGIGHSGSFTYDGKVLIVGHEPGGGTGAECDPNDTVVERSLFFYDVATGARLGSLVRDGNGSQPGRPRLQTSAENCTWHNFNVIPTYKGYYAVSGNYQAGISVIDFTNPGTPTEIAFADPAPFAATTAPTAGNWSSHYYNGKIYESDIRRGVIVWDLDHDSMRRVRTPDMSNPQTQLASFAQDLEGPAISIAQPLEGAQFKQGQQHIVDFSCTDNDSGVESCVGSVADGAALDTSKIGIHTFTVTAKDKAGTETTKSVQFMVNSTDVTTTPGATVPATLALSLGTAPTFPAFTPGVDGTYNASTAANVVSTAGNALISVSDPSSTNTGKLVNGAFTLANPLQASATSAAGTGAAFAPVGGSAAPTSLLTYTGPTSNDTVTLNFRQTIGRTEALRTGTYSKTLTFTLSTTAP